MYQFIESLLDYIFPRQCLGCSAYDWWLCPDCALKNLQADRCMVATALTAQTGIASVFTLGPYKNPFWRDAVGLVKFHRVRSAAEPLGHVLAYSLRPLCDRYQRSPDAPPLAVPIPLHRKRLRSRGFNQSELIARACCGSLGWQCEPSVLVRAVHAPSQTAQAMGQREQNVRGAYAVSQQGKSLIRGRDVVLFDDVVTTGSTVIAAAQEIKKHGPNSIHVVAVCRGR
ncbi:MAG: phosphoribosyltransferase family protein [Candidatus Kerfeldbacteria bacterium]